MRASEPTRLAVSVVHASGPGQLDETVIDVPTGATAMDALLASGIFGRHPMLDEACAVIGVWGRRCEVSTLLSDGDRVEVYRPLRIDPKDARRARHRALVAARKPAKPPLTDG